MSIPGVMTTPKPWQPAKNLLTKGGRKCVNNKHEFETNKTSKEPVDCEFLQKGGPNRSKKIKKEKENWDLKGQKARLHLRADGKVHFTYVRRVIRAAAAAGVNEVIFVSLWSRSS